MNFDVLADLFVNLPFAVSVVRLERRWDPESLTTVWLNPEGERVTGLSAAVVVGRPVFEHSPRTRGSAVADAMIACLRSGASHDLGEVPSTLLPGRWFRVRVFPLAGDHVAVAYDDVTDRRHSEREMRLWSGVFERAQWGVVVGSADGRTLERMNPAFAAMHGYTVEELTGRPILEVFAPEARAELPERIARCHRDGHHTFESVHLHRDGHTFPVLVDMTAVKSGEHGDVLFRAVNVQDVTLLKQTETALRAAMEAAEANARELEAFSYAVSHDLRAPLRAVDGFSQALLEDCDLDAVGRDHLGRIRGAAQRMGVLIDALLDLSRVSRAALHRERVDLSALAGDVADDLRARWPGRSVALVVAAGLSAEGDPRLLRVVLENLLGNAWKFTANRAEARVEVGREGGAFFVRDDGVGFDMAYAAKLFGAFQRLHGVREFEGTGIGLATVQRIVHRHGGTVRAEAEVGRGATFFFTLGGDG